MVLENARRASRVVEVDEAYHYSLSFAPDYGMNGKEGERRKHHDRISEMPDDILIPIISHLNVKEAADTSILTPRWRYLFTYTTRLHFPPFKINQDLIRSFPHHINTINRVLDSHRGNRIKEFRVYTYSLKGAPIDKWFEFALAKDVEILHIHMEIGTTTVDRNKDVDGYYPLPENLNMMGETLICLKELSLLGIDVNDGEIQLLLDKFPLLESLSIKGSGSMRHVSIVGHSSTKLKHLEISEVRNSGLIEIDIENLVNLVSLLFLKLAFSLNIKNVPKLVEFSMCDNHNCTGARILSGMSSSIHHQLQTLKIFTDPYCTKEYEQLIPLQLNGLKNLVLQHRVADFDNKIRCFDPFYIIRACPSLEKLEIKFSSYIPSFIKVNEYYEEYTVLDEEHTKKLCPELKRMKISGFKGSPSELKFVFSILKNINALEELVVETWVENKKNRKLKMEHAQRYFGPRALKVVVI